MLDTYRHAREGLSCATEDVRENHSSRMELSDRVRTGPAGRTHPARLFQKGDAISRRCKPPPHALPRPRVRSRAHPRTRDRIAAACSISDWGPAQPGSRAITLVSLVPCVPARGACSLHYPLMLSTCSLGLHALSMLRRRIYTRPLPRSYGADARRTRILFGPTIGSCAFMAGLFCLSFFGLHDLRLGYESERFFPGSGLHLWLCAQMQIYTSYT